MPAAISTTTCVIGGAGFIGRAVVAELVARGRQVIVVGRGDSPQGLPAGVRYLENSVEAGTDVVRIALEAATEVVDLAYATSPGTSFQDPVNDILVNVPETVRLFELAATMSHLRKFVWISSGGTVYGRTPAVPISELHQTLPLSPYGITKLALEKYAHMYFETRQLPIVCVRPANAYGQGQRPYSGQGFVATAIASILDGRPLMLFGEQGTVRDYLHVTDMATGIVAALLEGVPGEVYNLGSGEGFTNRQVLDMLTPLAQVSGHSVVVEIKPPRPFDVPANILDCHKLQAATGWQREVSLEQGLAQTWAWFAGQTSKVPYQTAL
ncbi:NAD-dependent epimerase/dehydratase family protein [Hymenobacter rubripertinctus]|uniref:NAD-dependent epimerase/dehydratase family protein n=1 Tax=Hymenobacter rubripertinctus TaxID=2029981 RepID=A0A418QWN2_9BACT|nr:NAD-dependent epimerase/dehydratase family protein [Hymenobacter rubripertinctus]RIY09588.1 NAD-dependent epimerase/dehydratase family protein [Hymenobacter rubripertinctus]